MPINSFKQGNDMPMYIDENVNGSQLLMFATTNPALDAYYYPSLIEVELKSPRWIFSAGINFSRSNPNVTAHNFTFDAFTKDINGDLIPAYTSAYVGIPSLAGAVNPMALCTIVCDPSMTTVNINGGASAGFQWTSAGKISTAQGMYANARNIFPLQQTYNTYTAGSPPNMQQNTVWPYGAVKKVYIAVGFVKSNALISGLEIDNVNFRMMAQ
jgi:hypothetical protein